MARQVAVLKGQHWGMWRSPGLREGKEPSPGGGWQGKPRVRPPNYRLARAGHEPGTPRMEHQDGEVAWESCPCPLLSARGSLRATCDCHS